MDDVLFYISIACKNINKRVDKTQITIKREKWRQRHFYTLLSINTSY